MLKKIIFSCLLLTTLNSVCDAQIMEEKTQRLHHYIGIQGNELIRQLVNFGGGTVAASNPYFVTYQLTNAKSLWGFRSGLGYSSKVINTDNLPSNKISSDIKAANIKMGIEKTFVIGSRFAAAAGIDGAWGNNSNVTKNTFISIDSTTQTITDKINTISAGPGIRLMYFITPRFALGAESNYWISFNNVLNIQETRTLPSPFGPGFYNKTESSSKNNTANISFPSVVYLILKL